MTLFQLSEVVPTPFFTIIPVSVMLFPNCVYVPESVPTLVGVEYVASVKPWLNHVLLLLIVKIMYKVSPLPVTVPLYVPAGVPVPEFELGIKVRLLMFTVPPPDSFFEMMSIYTPLEETLALKLCAAGVTVSLFAVSVTASKIFPVESTSAATPVSTVME